MNEQELIRKLNSVGKTIFVTYFSTFQSYSKGVISKEDCINVLVSNKVSNDNGAAIRCGNAKRIFDEGMECDALIIVTESNILPSELIRKAEEIIRNTCK